MSEIDVLIRSIDDKFEIRRGDSAASAASVIMRLLKDIEGSAANPNEYKVLVAYQLLQPELELKKILNIEEDEQRSDSKTVPLDALDIKTGHYLIFVKPSVVQTMLRLEINGVIYKVKEQGYSVGREDKAEGIFPNLDLTPYLGSYERKVSRSLLNFKEFDGKWKVILDEKARTNVFVDGERLRHGDVRDVSDAINIGNSSEDPYVRIKTTVVSG